jgi:hypothetical protein
MYRLLCSAVVATALVTIPAAFTTQFSDEARAEATDKATDKATKTTPGKKKKREQTKGQKAARERMKQCGQEWKAAKSAGTVEKGVTWPKFWSACNTRLKAKST